MPYGVTRRTDGKVPETMRDGWLPLVPMKSVPMSWVAHPVANIRGGERVIR